LIVNIVKRGWFPALITAVGVLGLIFYDKISYTITVPVLIVMLCIGIVVAVINARQAQVERQSLRLSQLAAHFSRRFMGNSTVSIFAIIDTLFGLENQPVWEWARGAEMTRRVFDSWAEHFAGRVEADLRNRRFTSFLQTHINELWALNNHYYEFIEQFSEIAQRFEVPRETVERYRKFTEEYNLFVESFRDAINELKTIARTQLEAPSVKTARELAAK
jgi:ABC-type multidrug transport system fused ATPase/permease subunit